MVSAFSGCQLRTVHSADGVLTWDHIQPAIAAKIYYRTQTGLISLENTHNMAGGVVTPLAVFERIWEGAREAGPACPPRRRAHLSRSHAPRHRR